jgi:hypothetical protein
MHQILDVRMREAECRYLSLQDVARTKFVFDRDTRLDGREWHAVDASIPQGRRNEANPWSAQ